WIRGAFTRHGAGHEGERPVLDNSFRRLSRFAAGSGNPLALVEESRSRRLPAIYTGTGGYRGPPALRILRSRRNARGKALNGLAGILAHYPTRAASSGDSDHHRTAYRLLDHLLALALEVSRRSRRCAPYRPTSDRARLLSADRAWTAQPTWALVASSNRPHARIYLRRPGDRLHHLQPAFRCAAFLSRVWHRRSPLARSLRYPRRLPPADVLPHHSAALNVRSSHRRGAQLRPYHG